MSWKSRFAQPFTDIDNKQSSFGQSVAALDGLRGLAVLIVIASHTSAFGMHGQGSLGVLLFFFLSGYVLSLPYIDRPERLWSGNELLRYATNRCLRIVPAYVVAVFAIAWFVGGNVNWFLANVLFLKGWNHLWSVAEEVRFYLLFPIVILACAALKSMALRIVLLLVLTLISFRFRNAYKIDMMDGRFVGFYFWMFLGGMTSCALVAWPLARSFFAHSVVRRCLVYGSGVVLAFVFFSSDHMIKHFWHALIPGLPPTFALNGWKVPLLWYFLFLWLMIGVNMHGQSAPGRVLQHRLLRHLGLLSYSLYLFHMPILLALRGNGFRQEGLFFAVLFLTYVAAYLTYVIVEKPAMTLKRKRTPAQRGEQPLTQT